MPLKKSKLIIFSESYNIFWTFSKLRYKYLKISSFNSIIILISEKFDINFNIGSFSISNSASLKEKDNLKGQLFIFLTIPFELFIF